MTERLPEDDFDEVASQLRGRRGAHRQAPRRLASVLPVVGVLGAVVAVGWAVTAATGLTGGSDAASTSAESAAVSTPASPSSPAPTTAPSSSSASSAPEEAAEEGAPSSDPGAIFSSPASSAAEEEAPSSAPGATAPPSSSSAPAAVDEDVDVVVLNATRTSGLAASTAADLQADGWTVASTGNERDVQPATTVVLFPTEDLEATAVAVAGDLGSKVIARLDAGAAKGSVTVLVGADRVR